MAASSHWSTSADEQRVAEQFGCVLKRTKLNGIHIRYADAVPGDHSASPALVLLLHGWPESWYSWRHQLRGLSTAGFRAVAPDMRGYGGTSAPSGPKEE